MSFRYNGSGVHDPTAGKALENIAKDNRPKQRKKINPDKLEKPREKIVIGRVKK